MSPPSPGGRRALVVVVSAVVAACVVAGMLLLGSPGEERRRRLDERRLDDLQALRSRVAEHYRARGTLPASLADLAGKTALPVGMTDPASAAPYGYEVIDATSFRLCATFDLPTPDEPARMRAEPWAHRGERQCYRFRVGRPAGRTFDTEPAPALEEEDVDSAR